MKISHVFTTLVAVGLFSVTPSAEAQFVWTPPTTPTSTTYTPSFTIHTAGSLWTVEDGNGGSLGHFTVGDNRLSGWNPTLSTRAFNIYGQNGANDFYNNPIVNNDVVPGYNPDVRDADPVWGPAANWQSVYYALELAQGAGGLAVLTDIYANAGHPDSNAGVQAGEEWVFGLWPWVNNPNRNEQVLPYSGTFDSSTISDDGTTLTLNGILQDTNGEWDIDFWKPDGLQEAVGSGNNSGEEHFLFGAGGKFEFESSFTKEGNSFLYGNYTLQEWSNGTATISPFEAAPVPEPASLAIWGMFSGAGLIAARRRRKKQVA